MRRSAATPNSATGFDDADLAELRALATHERCVAIGETGLDFYREGAPRADQERAFAAQIALARETGQAARDPLAQRRRADARRSSPPKQTAWSVVMHCFSMPEHLGECLQRGYAISFAGNVTYRSAPIWPMRQQVPDDILLLETDAPFLTPQIVRKHRNQPAFVAHTAAFLAELRGSRRRSSGRRSSATRLACSAGR